jgi:type VI secretion system secreted protein VgrG
MQNIAETRDLSRAQLAFQVAGSEADRFSVVRFRGTEGLCQLYRFEIDLACTDEQLVALEDVVGKSASLRVDAVRGSRRFHGIISRFELTGETSDQTYFRAELVPNVWLLTHRYDSRIFQNISVPNIIADVLARAGIVTDQLRFSLQQTYAPREYCVQYRETDYNFIARLMEEEGIWWCFEQQENLHVLVMADSTAAYSPIDGTSELPYQPPTGLNVVDEHVFRFRLGRSVRPGAVALNDFNFENPKLDLRCRHDAGRDSELEFSDYPGEYLGQADGTMRARLRTEEFEAGRVLGIGQSSCHRFAPGRTFDLSEHPTSACNGSYLLTAICHEGKQATTRTSGDDDGRASVLGARAHQSLLAARQSSNPDVRELAESLLQLAARLGAGDPTAHRARSEWLFHAGQVVRDIASTAAASGGHPADALALPNLMDDVARTSLVDFDAPSYACRFECIPAAVSYRPPRITPWPVMRGTQTARVVGPHSEEIYCDEYGRVKVRFHWDRQGNFDEQASCWIRVSQGMAGGAYGMLFLPRVGQEVIVDFLEGDPDRPIITGRVYNKDHMPPYKLPDDKTISAIRTCSSKGAGGANEIRFNDAKGKEQLLLHAQNSLHLRARGSRFESVCGDAHSTVAGDARELVKKNKHEWVKLDLREQVDGSKWGWVQGDAFDVVKGQHDHYVKGQYRLHNNQGIVLASDTSLTLWCAGNFIKIDESGVTILGKMVKINSGGAADPGAMGDGSFPEKPIPADTTEFGHNVRYAAEPTDQQPPDEAGPDKKTSWIEIELVDDLGRPCAGEPFALVEPDGREQRGVLNEKGLAHVLLRELGACSISFPNLDAAAWEKA